MKNFCVFGAILVTGCSGATLPLEIGNDGGAVSGDGSLSGGGDSGQATDATARNDGSLASSDDGTPMHVSCVAADGTALGTAFGRMDGYLRAVVLPTSTSCGGDHDHVKLRVEAGGKIYDFAVDVFSTLSGDVFEFEKDAPLSGIPWAEGWHSAGVTFDYPGTLKVSSGEFTQMAEGPLVTKIDAALKSANHVSVYATPYASSGAHKVHRNGGTDGAIVLNPTTANPHFMVFRFSTQTF